MGRERAQWGWGSHHSGENMEEAGEGATSTPESLGRRGKGKGISREHWWSSMKEKLCRKRKGSFSQPRADICVGALLSDNPITLANHRRCLEVMPQGNAFKDSATVNSLEPSLLEQPPELRVSLRSGLSHRPGSSGQAVGQTFHCPDLDEERH